MKLMLKIFVTLLFTAFYGVVEAKIIFDTFFYDFGEIAEDGGAVEHIFTLRNTSAEPVVIVAVRSSCGCTKAEFSRKPIMPDSTATIKVVFNPLNYPGAFARKVTVFTADGPLKEQLLVKGTVIPRKKTVEERYPLVMGGGVRAAANAHSFGYVEHGKVALSSFEIYNSSAREVSLAVDNPYSELEFISPAKLAAGEEAVINFSCLLPENSELYGSLAYSVNLLVDGQKSQYPFIINGLAIDSRDINANNRAQMIVLSENFIKFGAVKRTNEKLVRRLTVSNDGNEPLVIRKLELDCDGCRARLSGEMTIAAGDNRVVEVEINPSRLPFGAVVERLRIVSNDPKMPVYTIRVSAIVER
ncbi:MAG: DUF1573 domain-containing protein [Rikenellaceae bacterium]|nr:DUF1573 domain-containing protein [Rikenellaceae bacterium]